jgi:hypothetical protein
MILQRERNVKRIVHSTATPVSIGRESNVQPQADYGEAERQQYGHQGGGRTGGFARRRLEFQFRRRGDVGEGERW